MLALALTLVVFGSGCALRHHKGNLDRMQDAISLPEEEAATDTANLQQRVVSLYDILKTDKLTTNLTKRKIAGFFNDEKDLVDFVAIYSSLFRRMGFKKERVASYKIQDILIEENGVIGLVRIDIKGRYYSIWTSKISEVQEWQKIGSQWYILPKVY